MPITIPTLSRLGTALDEDFNTANVPESILGKLGHGALGLLGTVGRGLDWPARVVRRGITGLDEPTGRDVLKSLGIDIGPNKPGFDIGDIVSFGTEVVADPLSYVGGLGALTKIGRAGKGVERAQQALRSTMMEVRGAEEAGDLARLAKATARQERYAKDVAALGDIAPLEKGWEAQAKAGQRQLMDIGIPFTKYKVPIMGGESAQKLLGTVGKAGEWVGGHQPATTLSKLFKHETGLEKMAGMRAIRDEAVKEAYTTGAERYGTQGRVVSGISERLGVKPEDVIPELNKATQTPWLPTTPASMTPLSKAFRAEEPTIAELGREIRVQQSKQLKFEQLMGEPITSVEGIYQHRPLSSEGNKYFAAERGAQPVSPLASTKEFPTEYGAQVKRTEELAGLPVEEANKVWYANEVQRKTEEMIVLNKSPLERKLAIEAIPKKLFIENPIEASAIRGVMGDVATANTILFKNAAREFARPNAVGPTIGEVYKAANILPTGENLALRFDQDVADELLNIRGLVTDKGKLTALYKAGEGIRKYMSQSLLLPFAAYHGRNQQTNTAATALAGLFHPIEYFKDYTHAAKQIWKGADEAREWEAMGLLGSGQTREFSQEAFQQKIKELTVTGEPTLLQKMALPTTTPGVGKIFRGGQKVGELIEGASRVAHYKAARRAGMDHLSAMDSVKKYLFDFTEMSDFEKKYLRTTVFFYAWQRKQLELLAKSMVDKTGEMATLFRATTQPSAKRGSMPPWLRSTTAIPFGKDTEGNQQYFSGLGSPLEPIQNLDILNYPITERIGSQLTPALRTPIEFLTGKDMRMQADIPELTKAYRGFPYNLLPGYREGTTPQGKQVTSADPWALWALRASPVSRAASTMGQLQDPRKELVNRIMSVTTGARVVSVDESGERKRQAIEAINAQLQAKAAEGKAKLFKTYFATGAEGEKDPETQLLLKLSQKIRKGP